jgi:hypothetical protein
MLWTSVTGAATYNLQVSTVSTFVSRVVDDTLTSTSQACGGLSGNTTYYWRVNAKNAGGTSAWSSVWSFTTLAAPGAAVLLSPSDGATNVVLNPSLIWSAPVTGGAPSSYLVQVASEPTFASSVYEEWVNALTTTRTASGLSAGTTYYWRVGTQNDAGGTWSTVWSFTTGAMPAAPTLVSPVNGATDVSITPTLIWNASAGATNYQLQLATDSSFVSIIFSDSTLTSTSQAISSLVNSTTYYWRVRAKNAGGSSAWSSEWSFTTIGTGGLTAPVLISPANSVTGISINPTMVWNYR